MEGKFGGGKFGDLIERRGVPSSSTRHAAQNARGLQLLRNARVNTLIPRFRSTFIPAPIPSSVP